MKGGYYLNSGVLFSLAVSGYDRLKSAPADKTGGQNDALVAILFSAATLEAFVMELALMAESDAALFGHTRLQSLAVVLEETENSRGSIRLKFLVSKVVLGGDTYDKGAQPYQDFDTLFAMRDAIIHMKPEKITEEPHKILQRLRAKDLCEDAKPGVTVSWLSQVSTRAVARWACNVVVEMAESLKACLPVESKTTPLFSSSLGRHFERVE